MNAGKATTSGQTATSIAHSKLILIGEHAVVHGQPAIAIPFPLVGTESEVEHVPGAVKIDSTFYHGPIDSAPSILEGIAMCIKETLKTLNLPEENLLIKVKSSIPPGKGLGSSASSAVAVIRSLFSFFNKTYTENEILGLANIAETYAHGVPSGIDPLTITSGFPVWYAKSEGPQFIKPSDDFYFIVADSGRTADTRTAIESVANLLKSAPKRIQSKLDRIGELTSQVKTALENTGKQLLGTFLNEAQKELESLGVSDAGLNRLIYIARQEGALGAKLTGGGNGGCIIALAKDEVHSRHLADRLLKFGAHAVWPFKLKKADPEQ